jgi:5-formaminoimidazole-4-carboxamide-1-(beta)-D-ribofuranosyl 5'-monophosphate synthetase
MRSAKISEILSGYDKNNLAICALGSHSALDIARGASDEGLKFIAICEKGREKTYSEYFLKRQNSLGETVGCVDEVLLVDKFSDILKPSFQQQLRDLNVLFVPHRSFQVYLDFDYDSIENTFEVPMLGSRDMLRAEERTSKNNQYDLMRKAGIRMPLQFKKPEDIDRLVIVKANEKARVFERAFFFCTNKKEFHEVGAQMIKAGKITQQSLDEAIIEEFIIGAQVNFNYFYSPITGELELVGTDTRRQTSLEGLMRVPADAQIEVLKHFQPKFEEAGHIACTVLESMLEHIYDLGEKFVETAKKEYAPGIIGPFALQGAILPGPPKKEAVIFDVSMRMPGSPGVKYTPYSEYFRGQSFSAGRRLAHEVVLANKADRLSEIIT